LLVAFATIAACASRPSAPTESSFQTPQNSLQLIGAIKQLSASGRILDSGLYTVDNLKRAFGGSDADVEVGKYDVLIGSYWAKVSGFPWMPSQDNMPLRLRRLTMYPDGELQASVDLSFQEHPAGIDLAAIERQFGKSWTEKPQYIPFPSAGSGPSCWPTAKTIVYKFGDNKSGWTAQFNFDCDGVLSSMHVEMNRAKR
jgi:hypothetical protein